MKKNWFIGIDVSKKTLDVVIYDSAKKHADTENYKQLSNSKEGYDTLLSWLKKKKAALDQMVVGLEHTGTYSFDLRLYLEKHQIDYCTFNPLHLKRSLGLVRGKNDKVDAERIAYFTYLHREELTYSKLSGSTVLRLQDLSAERKRFVTQQAEYKALLTDNKERPRTSTLLRAQNMVDVLEGEIKTVEEEMIALVGKDPAIAKNYELLTGIKGIGSVNAISTLIHTNNFEAFETARQYACYLGIAPFEHTSGTSVKGATRVSHIGAKLLKADLSQAAKSAIVWDKELKEYYIRKTMQGKAFGVVLNAVKFKLICRMFAVVKRGTPFVELNTYKS